jgi:hypothetical protein
VVVGDHVLLAAVVEELARAGQDSLVIPLRKLRIVVVLIVGDNEVAADEVISLGKCSAKGSSTISSFAPVAASNSSRTS